MGYSVAAAAAVVFLAFIVAGSAGTIAFLDSLTSVQRAQLAAAEAAAGSAHTTMSILSVKKTGTTITVEADNTGSVPLDARGVDLLANGLPATLTSRTVEGSTGSLWLPQRTLTVKYTANALPADVSVVAPNGAVAYWRA